MNRFLFTIILCISISQICSAQDINKIRAALQKSKVVAAKQKSNSSERRISSSESPNKPIFATLNITTDMDCKIVINKEVYDIKVGKSQKIPVYQENISYYLFWEQKDFSSESQKIELSSINKGKTIEQNIKAKEKYKILEKRNEDDNLLFNILSDINVNMISITIDEHTKMTTLTLKDFEIAKYEVRVLEFAAFAHFTQNQQNKSINSSLIINPNSVTTDKEHKQGIDWSYNAIGKKHDSEDDFLHPVVNVSWEEAIAFCAWLNNFDKNYTYRLPSSEEWQYAASCSHDNSYGEYPWNLNDPITELANLADASLARSIKYKRSDVLDTDDNTAFTATVGSYLPNCFGIYDMGGNVAEWCSNDFIDNKANDNIPKKEYRGGSYYTHPDKAKLSQVFGLAAQQRHSGIGFRLVRQVK